MLNEKINENFKEFNLIFIKLHANIVRIVKHKD